MSDTTRFLVFGLIGALLGTGGADATPLLGGLIGVLLAMQLRDRKALRELRARLDDAPTRPTLEMPAGIEQPEPSRPTAASDRAPAELSRASAAARAESEASASEPHAVAEATASRRAATPRPPAAPLLPEPVAAAARRVWAVASRANPIALVALLVLFVGLGLLLRYVAVQGLIPVAVRLAATALAGAVLVGLGWRLRERTPGFARTLQGGGVAVLYLTVYAAYALFGFIGSPVAILLLAAIAAGCAGLSLLQDEPLLALIGVAGGFAAPVLAGTAEGSHVLLLGYYALLNLGVLGIAWQRGWRSVALTGFAATFVTGSLWGGVAYTPELYASTQPFLILSVAVYLALSIRFAVRSLRAEHRLGRVLVEDGSLVFGLPAAAFSLQAGLVAEIPYGRAWSAVALAVVYLVATAVLFRRQAGLRLLAESFLAIGLVFVTLAVPLAFSDVTVGSLWVLEGAALVWTGARQGTTWMRGAGVLLSLAAATVLLGAGVLDLDAAFTTETLTGWLVAVALGLASYALRRFTPTSWPLARAALLGFGLFWWGATAFVQVLDLVPDAHIGTALLLAAAGSGLLFRTLGDALRWPGLRAASLGLVGVAALLWVGQAFEADHPFEGFAGAGWAAVALAAVAALRDGRPAGLRRLAVAGAVWTGAAVLAREAHWLAGRVMDGSGWSPAAVALVLAAALWATLRLPDTNPSERRLALGGLALGAFGWALGAMIPSGGGAAPLPYLPVLAPLDFAAVALCAGLVYVLRHASEPWRAPLGAAVAALAFVLLTVSVGRAVHQLGGVAFTAEDLFASSTFQAALAVAWTLLAVGLTAVASRRGLRVVWFVGIALLALVVLKLFVVDLSQAAALVRIGAFLVVGVLGLVVAYASPLPPAAPENETDAVSVAQESDPVS